MVLGTGVLARERPLRRGDVLPEGTVFSLAPAAISTTHWAIRVTLNDSSGPQGIFVGRTNKVLSLGAPAGVALATLLALGGALLLRRETR